MSNDDNYRFSRADHELLVDLTAFTSELRSIAKPWSRYQRVECWSTLLAAMTFSIGVMLIVGGRQRVSINAYWMVATYGGPTLWGVGFIVAGIITGLCTWRRHRMLRWALLLEAIPYAAVAVNFAVTSVLFDDVVLIGTPMFAWVTAMHGFLSDYARKEF